MIRVLTTSDVYSAAQDWFIAHDAEHHSPVPRAERSLRFVNLLAQYSATVNTGNRVQTRMYACDFLGVCPGVDTIDFADERLYTMFILTCT